MGAADIIGLIAGVNFIIIIANIQSIPKTFSRFIRDEMQLLNVLRNVFLRAEAKLFL